MAPQKRRFSGVRMTPKRLRRLLRLYGPYLGAGVRVDHISEDWRELRVALHMRWYNRNAFGTHFGGSLYSMVDPHLALLLSQLLGSEYVVWDKSASIDFKRPGLGTVRATPRVEDEDLATIREKTGGGESYLHDFKVEIRDEEELIVAEVHKVLYVRRKKSERAES